MSSKGKIRESGIKEMRKSERIVTVVFSGLFMVAGLAACGHSKAGTPQSQESVEIADTLTPLPPVVGKLAASMVNGDAPAFASVVDYPLARPYPLKPVRDSVEMVDYFPVMVDDSIRNVVSRATRADWSLLGWRGWTLDGGQYLWVEDKLYSYPYLSEAELGLLKLVRRRDMATLPPDLRRDWKPVMCFVSDSGKEVFRIDERGDSGLYRLLVYDTPKHLNGNPAMNLEGRMRQEGTMQNRIFTFRGSNGEEAELYADDAQECQPGLTLRQGPESRPRNILLLPSYWLDLSEGTASPE